MKSSLMRSVVASIARSYDGYRESYPLFKCSARVIVISDYRMVVLKSYSTYTAYYNMENKTVYSFGSYSATSSQHLSKFVKWLIHSQYDVKYIVYAYDRSDHCVVYDLYANERDYATYTEHDYSNRTLRNEMNRELRRKWRLEEYSFLCDLPAKAKMYFDSLTPDEQDEVVRKYFYYTVR